MSNIEESFKTLEIPNNSTLDIVRQAYLKQAKKYHPDRNVGDLDATSKFQEIGHAYESIIKLLSGESATDTSTDTPRDCHQTYEPNERRYENCMRNLHKRFAEEDVQFEMNRLRSVRLAESGNHEYQKRCDLFGYEYNKTFTNVHKPAKIPTTPHLHSFSWGSNSTDAATNLENATAKHNEFQKLYGRVPRSKETHTSYDEEKTKRSEELKRQNASDRQKLFSRS